MSNPSNRNPESFIQEFRNIQLSSSEKGAMRERLISYADLHDVHVRASVPSPLMWWRTSAVFAVVLIMLVSGVGVSYASENSLPGQPLYEVKVSVLEPVQGALIPTTAGKASWENVLTERRLAEASTLAAQNNLTATTSAYIEQQVAIHTVNAEKAADILALRGDETGALQVRSDLEARLSAHATLLAALQPRLADAGDASTSASVALLFRNVDGARAAAEQSRRAAEVTVIASSAKTSASKKTGYTASGSAGEIAVADVDMKRHSEESSLFAKRAATTFSLMATTTSAPATTTASTTQQATSTVSATATSTPGL